MTGIERYMLLIYAVLLLAAPTLAASLTYNGHITAVRYALSLMFFGGSMLSLAGYTRYMPPGPTMPALLMLGIGQAFGFSVLGLAFLVLSHTAAGTTTPNGGLITTYALFAVAGTAASFKGVYLFFGARRGWINREFKKWFIFGGK